MNFSCLFARGKGKEASNADLPGSCVSGTISACRQHELSRASEAAMAIIKAVPGKTRVGWIGTGVMGRWMCGHLRAKGYAAIVYNRTKEKAQPLLAEGASWVDTPKAVAERSDVVFAIVGYPKDVREVFLGPQGALAGSKAGGILVDMTTSEPSLAIEICQAAKAKGVGSIDAPV